MFDVVIKGRLSRSHDVENGVRVLKVEVSSLHDRGAAFKSLKEPTPTPKTSERKNKTY